MEFIEIYKGKKFALWHEVSDFGVWLGFWVAAQDGSVWHRNGPSLRRKLV